MLYCIPLALQVEKLPKGSSKLPELGSMVLSLGYHKVNILIKNKEKTPHPVFALQVPFVKMIMACVFPDSDESVASLIC